MHSKKFTKSERRGLPGGPNEMFTYVTGVFSTEGYKKDSPDINNPFNIIPSGKISMKDVDFPVMGIDNLGNKQMMTPGGEYQFPGDMVFELPMAQFGLNDIKRSLSDYVQGKQGYIPDIFTGGIPTKRALNTATSYANPKNYNSFLDPIKSYDNYDTFDKAFSAARDDAGGPGGFFLYNGKRHSTKYKGEPGNKETADIFDQLKDEPYYERLIKLWIEQGQPNISMGTDDTNMVLPISQAPVYNFAEGVLPETGVDLFAEGNRPHLAPFTKGNDIYIRKPSYPASGKDQSKRKKQLAENILEELTHNYQINKMGTAKFLGTLVGDEFKSWVDNKNTYHNPGTLEHEAHGAIEDAFNDYVFDNKDFPKLKKGGDLYKAQKGFFDSMKSYLRGEQGYVPDILTGGLPTSSVVNAMKPMATELAPLLSRTPAGKIIKMGDDALQIASVPGALVAEAVEGIQNQGDQEFNFMDAMPNLNDAFYDPTTMKTVAGVKGVDGLKGFGLNLVTDPLSYVGVGVLRSILGKGATKLIKPVVSSTSGKLSNFDAAYIKDMGLNVKNYDDLLNQYNQANKTYRTVNISDDALRNPEFLNAAKKAGVDINNTDELRKYIATSVPYKKFGNVYTESLLKNTNDKRSFMFTSPNKNFTIGYAPQGYTARMPIFTDDATKLSIPELTNRLKSTRFSETPYMDLINNPNLANTLPSGTRISMMGSANKPQVPRNTIQFLGNRGERLFDPNLVDMMRAEDALRATNFMYGGDLPKAQFGFVDDLFKAGAKRFSSAFRKSPKLNVTGLDDAVYKTGRNQYGNLTMQQLNDVVSNRKAWINSDEYLTRRFRQLRKSDAYKYLPKDDLTNLIKSNVKSMEKAFDDLTIKFSKDFDNQGVYTGKQIGIKTPDGSGVGYSPTLDTYLDVFDHEVIHALQPKSGTFNEKYLESIYKIAKSKIDAGEDVSKIKKMLIDKGTSMDDISKGFHKGQNHMTTNLSPKLKERPSGKYENLFEYLSDPAEQNVRHIQAIENLVKKYGYDYGKVSDDLLKKFADDVVNGNNKFGVDTLFGNLADDSGKAVDVGSKSWNKIVRPILENAWMFPVAGTVAGATEYKEGGSVSWQWKGNTYSGTLIPSRETATHRYARTKNGKIKSLPKKQDAGEVELTQGFVKDIREKDNEKKRALMMGRDAAPPRQNDRGFFERLGDKVGKALGRDMHLSYLDFPKTDAQAEFQKKMDDLFNYYNELDPTGEDPQYQAVLDEKIQELVNSPLGVQSTKDMDLNLQNEDALRHAYSTAEASKLLKNKVRNSKFGNMLDALGIDDVVGFLGSNALGIGHELQRFSKDERPFLTKLKESGQDIYNNILGSIEALDDRSSEEVFESLRKIAEDGGFYSGQVSDLEYKEAQKKFGGKIRIYEDYINGIYDNSPNIKHVEKVYDKLNRVYKNRANQMNMSPQNFIMTHLVKR